VTDEDFTIFAFYGESYLVEQLPLDGERLLRDLTASELDITRALARGFTAAKIAKLRRSSKRTVEHQIQGLYRKLRVSSRCEFLREVRRRRGTLL
jgi:DNA-binding NarL/FixJ family response regulator